MNNEAVETLAQYRYDEHGQLSTVINRNGDTVRSFSYADGVMASHSNTDQIGTPLELTDSEGEVVWQATYRSWGGRLSS